MHVNVTLTNVGPAKGELKSKIDLTLAVRLWGLNTEMRREEMLHRCREIQRRERAARAGLTTKSEMSVGR